MRPSAAPGPDRAAIDRDQAEILVIGGGLAGCEAAWQAARLGVGVELMEMRPAVSTPAHETGLLAELVCSNSFKSDHPNSASGLLKAELRRLGSVILTAADGNRVEAGTALAVDRGGFAREVEKRIESAGSIRVIRSEARELDRSRVTVVASGPLTSQALAGELSRLFEEENLYFYDAVSPIVYAESLDRSQLFLASRYDKGEASYLNSPLGDEAYYSFREALLSAELFPLHPFEEKRYFEGCLPIEELAARGKDSLRFGPMKPVGLIDPATGERPFAVVQTRKENTPGTLYNMVGFQTRLKQGEQERVFRMLPGFEKAEFARYGSIHRNTYVRSPKLLKPTLNLKAAPDIFLAGQLTGVEGYMESTAIGYLAGANAALRAKGLQGVVPPTETLMGGLVRYLLGGSPGDFQPMNANWGLLPDLAETPRSKPEKYQALADRSLRSLDAWRTRVGW